MLLDTLGSNIERGGGRFSFHGLVSGSLRKTILLTCAFPVCLVTH